MAKKNSIKTLDSISHDNIEHIRLYGASHGWSESTSEWMIWGWGLEGKGVQSTKFTQELYADLSNNFNNFENTVLDRKYKKTSLNQGEVYIPLSEIGSSSEVLAVLKKYF
ncbi:MAG: hypothetical protein WC758_04175 [Candidatus Woesearchaeota archaeon]|jgi:hypothetical protein